MKLALRILVVFLFLSAAVIITYDTVPNHTVDTGHFDTLIVLGCPADPDGKPSPEQRERVLEAVREFRAGRADHLIVSGAAVHNQWPEAATMARVAEQAGVPAADVIVEDQARNTIQNIFYSSQIMQQHGWHTAEVVSSPSHLPRAALILSHYRFGWRTQASRWPVEYDTKRIIPYYIHEALGTADFRWFGFPSTPYLPPKP